MYVGKVKTLDPLTKPNLITDPQSEQKYKKNHRKINPNQMKNTQIPPKKDKIKTTHKIQ